MLKKKKKKPYRSHEARVARLVYFNSTIYQNRS